MDWNSGFSALYELRTVDPVSWTDSGSIDLYGGSVKRSSKSALIESADLKMTERIREGWVRVYLKARQTDDGAREALFTGLAMSPQKDINGTRESFPTECYSVLKPAADTLTPRGYYAPAGMPAADLAADLLRVGPAPITIEANSPKLLEPIVSEDSDSNLDMAKRILDAVGWRIRIDGDGTIEIMSAATYTDIFYDPYINDAVEPKIKDTDDWYSCPNCVRVVSGEECVEVKDENSDSGLSIATRQAARGGTGEIWKQESASTIGDGESLVDYANRKLKELQAHAREVQYTRRYNPSLTVSDLVNLHYPGQGIDGFFRITEQTITLGYGAKTQEKVVAV